MQNYKKLLFNPLKKTTFYPKRKMQTDNDIEMSRFFYYAHELQVIKCFYLHPTAPLAHLAVGNCKMG